ENWAIPMSRIVPELERRFPSLVLGRVAPGSSTPPATRAPAPSEGDAYEPNADLASAAPLATPLAIDGLAIASATDADWFVFAGDAKTHTITIDLSNAAGDLDLYLYDASGAELAKSITTTDQEKIEAPVSDGRLYVRVVGYGGATGAYALTID
ncbi:PPC domain-containing protein, partial [Myxococcota bacterium]|nr:PPC domain-containing protein [Myxococcota bacterium]